MSVLTQVLTNHKASPPIIRVWISASALSQPLRYGSGLGTNSAAVNSGGSNSTNVDQNGTSNYNGTSWSGSGALVKTRRDHKSTGTQTAGLTFLGYGNSLWIYETEKYNGTSWSTATSNILNRYMHCGCGTQNSTFMTGGNIPGTDRLTSEIFNGTSWSASVALPAVSNRFVAAGDPSAAVISGGGTTSRRFNGTAWSTGNSLVTYRVSPMGSGDFNNAIIHAGTDNVGWLQTSTETYNGTTWSLVQATLVTARSYGGECGNGSGALAIAGMDDFNLISSVEKYL